MPNDHTCIATPIIGGPSEPMLSCSGTSGPCKCQSLVEVPKSSLLQKTRQRLVVDAQGIYIYNIIYNIYIYVVCYQIINSTMLCRIMYGILLFIYEMVGYLSDVILE